MKIIYYFIILISFLPLFSYGQPSNCSYNANECNILEEFLILNEPVYNPSFPGINISEQVNGVFTNFQYLTYAIDQFGSSYELIVEDPDCSAGQACRIVEINWSDFGIQSLPELFGHNTYGIKKLQSLNLSYNHIQEIPESISSLNDLVYLNLNHNSIYSLPEDISNCPLTYLDLSYNDISQLPSDFGSLLNLNYLDLSRNNLEEFNYSNFSSLITLYLEGNKISEFPEIMCENNINWNGFSFSIENNHLCSNIPDCINDVQIYGNQDCNEDHIEIINNLIIMNNLNENSSDFDNDNQDNNFKYNEAGYQIWNLGNIKELHLGVDPKTDLEYNYNINVIPADIGVLSSLLILELQNNSISSIPSSIGDIDSLIKLNLEDNSITSNGSQGGIPNSLQNLEYLEILNLSQNQISQPNDIIYDLLNLKKLSLSENNILYLDSDIGNLNELTYLSVHNNNITSLPATISNLNLLQELWASNNNLFTFSDDLEFLTDLIHLDLANNSIPEIPDFVNNYNDLQTLYLNNNQISEIPLDLFSLTELQKLHLQNNYLSELPAQIGLLNNLDELYVHFNQIYELPQSICNLNIDISNNSSGSEIIQDLKLHQNFFCFNYPECINEHPDSDQIIGDQNCYGSDVSVVQAILDLNEINTSAVNVGDWDMDLQRLVGLDLSNTMLQNIGDGDNVIRELPDNIGYLAKLKEIDFSGNEIEYIPSSIEYLEELESLNLSNNSLEEIPDLSNLSSLTMLDISYNELEHIPSNLENLDNLNYLKLNDNAIDLWPDNSFSPPNLNTLDLSNNNIIDLPDENLDYLSSLISLDIHGNNLFTLPSALSELESLQYLNADFNKIGCNSWVDDNDGGYCANFQPLGVIGELDNLIELSLASNYLIELEDDFFSGSSITTVNLQSNNLLRLPESICGSNTIEIVDVSDNYLYCNNYYDENNDNWVAHQDSYLIPDCIDEIEGIILIGLIDYDGGSCDNYGCTNSDALNYEEGYEMSCSQTGIIDGGQGIGLNDCCTFVPGPDIYVNINGSNVSGQGTIEYPFSTIQKAIDSANDFEKFYDCNIDLSICEGDDEWNDELGNGVWDDGENFEDLNGNEICNCPDIVRVQNGTYYENIIIQKPVIVVSEAYFYDDPINKINSMNSTIIDGNISNGVADSSSMYIDSSSDNETILIYGFTFTNGRGGININNSNVRIEQSRIFDNISTQVSGGNGGGISILGNSNVKIINTTIENNRANTTPGRGGGLYVDVVSEGIITLENVKLELNRSKRGGGIYIKSGQVEFDNCLIYGNNADNGGGIYTKSDNLVFYAGIENNIDTLNTKIIENVADDEMNDNGETIPLGKGGGIYIEDTNINLNGILISGNEANQYGGAIYSEAYTTIDVSTKFDNLIIKENSAGIEGSVLYSDNSKLDFNHCTITDNHSNIVSEPEWSCSDGLSLTEQECCTDNEGFWVGSCNDLISLTEEECCTNNEGSWNGVFCTDSNVEWIISCSEGNAEWIFGNNQASGFYLANNTIFNFTNSISWDNGIREFLVFDQESEKNIQYSLTTTTVEGLSNISFNPEFENTRFYNLTRVSKALGSGVNIDETDFGILPNLDFFGYARELGINPDLGAIENFDYDIPTYIGWYVSEEADSIEQYGTSENPYKTINQSIDNALNGDSIQVSPGYYNENISFMEKKLFLTRNHEEAGIVTIAGDGNSSVVSIFEGDDIEMSHFTIIDGNAEYGGGISVVNASPILKDITIKDNKADFGGGIYLNSFNGILEDVIIEGNNAEQRGAGLYIVDSDSFKLYDLKVKNNERGGDSWTNSLIGGGICLENSQGELDTIDFENNSASLNGGALSLIDNSILETGGSLEFIGNEADNNGGAIYIRDSEFYSTGLTTNTMKFFDNISDAKGGGIFITSGILELENILLDSNKAEIGGALAIDSDENTSAIINNAILRDNQATYQGGVFYLNSSGPNINLKLKGLEIWDNKANQSAILYSNYGDVTFQNSMIAGNETDNYPGGILAKNTELSMINVTMTQNEVVENSSGSNLNIEKDSRLKVINSILWENTNNGREVYLKDDGPIKEVYMAYSVIRDGQVGIARQDWDILTYHDSNIEQDPLFISPEDKYLYVTKESPCVDAGINNITVWDDIISISDSLLIDGDGDGEAVIDIGAYEIRILSVFPGDLNSDGFVNFEDIAPVAMYFHKSGIPRYSQLNNWDEDSLFSGYGAISWDDYDNISGEELTHVDANGDGIIDERDVIAIGVNWGEETNQNYQEFVIDISDEDLSNLYRDELVTIYNSLSGQGEAFDEIRLYLESLLGIVSLPTKYLLYQNYPNPFNPQTTIRFDIPKDSFVSLSIYNIKGEKVRTLYNESLMTAGQKNILFNADRLSSGVYFIRIQADTYIANKKMLLIK